MRLLSSVLEVSSVALEFTLTRKPSHSQRARYRAGYCYILGTSSVDLDVDMSLSTCCLTQLTLWGLNQDMHNYRSRAELKQA